MANESKDESITIVLRLIRSFEHRTIRNVVYHKVYSEQTVKEFIGFVKKDISNRSSLPPPFRNFLFDTMKIQHKAFGAKTSDPVINTTNDDKLMLHENKTLRDSGVEHETEISFFVLEDYKKYQQNPQLAW